MRIYPFAHSSKLLLTLLCLVTLPFSLVLGEEKEVPSQNPQKKISKTKQELEGLVGGASQCVENRDCIAVPVGEKPCGGPEQYLVYSRKSPKISDINKLVASYLSLRKLANSSDSSISDCQFVGAPKVKCNSKKVCIAIGQ